MKKILSLFLALLLSVTAFSLTSCHGSKGTKPFEMPETFDTGKNYEITFWAKNDTNKTQVNIYRKAISDFEALYPNIKVTMRLYTDYSRIYNDVITNIATNTTPNVCITYPDHIATYLTGENTVAPLDTLMADARYGLGGSDLLFDSPSKEEIIPEYLSECYFDGHCYALPYMRSTEACYVNKDYVEKLGFTLPETLTWDFMFEVAEAAVEKDESGNFKINGQKVMIPIIYKSTDNMMIQYLKQTDAGYSDESGKIEVFNETTENFLKEISVHAGSGAFCTFKIIGYPANFLNAGQCIFAIDSTAGATWMGTDAPNLDISEDRLVRFETEVMTVPQTDPEHPQMISQGPSLCVFNKPDNGEVLASWLFAQFLLTNEVQTAYAETEGYVPVTSKAQNDPGYLDYLSRSGEDADHYDIKIKATKLLIDNVENTFTTPVFNGSASLRDAAGQMIENVTKSMRRNETVNDAYYEKLYSDMISLYRLDQKSGVKSGEKEFGALPKESVILLSALGGTWILLGGWFFYSKFGKNKRK